MRLSVPPPTRLRSHLERWRFPLAVWLLSRIFFLEAGALAARFARPADPATTYPGPPETLGYWAHWDGAWYISIARHGYEHTQWPASAAFFPAYPELLRGAIWVAGGAATAGIAVSSRT